MFVPKAELRERLEDAERQLAHIRAHLELEWFWTLPQSEQKEILFRALRIVPAEVQARRARSVSEANERHIAALEGKLGVSLHV